LQINREFNTTVFISSHILDELSRIADTIGIINKGSMLAEISMPDIRSKGIDLETYYLNLLKGAAENEKVNSVGA
jgi:ABC-2 type transport system ATP-binding protein